MLDTKIKNWFHELVLNQDDFSTPKTYLLKDFGVDHYNICDYSLKIISKKLGGTFRSKQYTLSFEYPTKSKQLINLWDYEKFVSEVNKYDFNSLKEILIKNEILGHYSNPISYLHLYENFQEMFSNAELQGFKSGKWNSDKDWERSFIYQYSLKEMGATSLTHDNFCMDSRFKNLFVVYIFYRSKTITGRYHDYYSIRQFCLYYKGIRVTDQYIEAILPPHEEIHSGNHRKDGLSLQKDLQGGL